MNSAVIKRSIKIGGRKSAVSLEDTFWTGLKEIAQSRRMTLRELVASIAATRNRGNLSSAIRVFVLEHYKNEAKKTNNLPSSRRATVGSDEGQST
jgi:predicted DNA-binding ribbon-helix-helix protein